MEMDNDKKNSGRKIMLLILLSICTLFVVYYTVMSTLAPGKKMDELRKEFVPDQASKKAGDSKFFSDSTYLRLMKEKAFLQSRVVMAGTDSIYLAINLADSSMNLEISGTVVHRAKIGSYKASRILTRNASVISAMLATPLTISSDLASIKKEPVMIKMAPKDTTEYKPDIMPDTSITEPVNYILEMTNGIRIFVYEQENTGRSAGKNQFRFDLNDRIRQTWDALKRVASFKVPEYHPYIKIKLPRADAKIIYRAIPRNGQIALFL